MITSLVFCFVAQGLAPTCTHLLRPAATTQRQIVSYLPQNRVAKTMVPDPFVMPPLEPAWKVLSKLRESVTPTATVTTGSSPQTLARPSKASVGPGTSGPSAVQVAAPTSPELADPMCSVVASDEEPGKILDILSRQSGINLIIITKSDVKVTIRLSNVLLSEAIQHICAMCDLAAIRRHATYVVGAEDKLRAIYPVEWAHDHPTIKAETAISRASEVYRTNYVNASQVADALTKAFPDKAVTIVVGPSSLSPELGHQDSSASTGVSTSALAKDASTADGSGSRLLLISGPPDLVAQALAMAKQFDKPRIQVSIAVRIDDISNDVLTQKGLAWTFGSLNLTATGTNKFPFGAFTATPETFSATLDALEQSDSAKTLASPSISVLDGERAFVLIGNRISYPVLVGYSQSNAPIFSMQQERVGIYLQVAVSISADNTITLTLYPQVSSVSSYLNVNGASYPQIATREAQSTLRLKSGESLVMGGLFEDVETSQLQKVPILGDIPFFKELFRHRNISKTRDQVIIMVTPTIVKETQK